MILHIIISYSVVYCKEKMLIIISIYYRESISARSQCEDRADILYFGLRQRLKKLFDGTEKPAAYLATKLASDTVECRICRLGNG